MTKVGTHQQFTVLLPQKGTVSQQHSVHQKFRTGYIRTTEQATINMLAKETRINSAPRCIKLQKKLNSLSDIENLHKTKESKMLVCNLQRDSFFDSSLADQLKFIRTKLLHGCKIKKKKWDQSIADSLQYNFQKKITMGYTNCFW